MKASYAELPAAIERMPEGHTKFRFDIEDKSTEGKPSFECREVDIHGALAAEKVIAAAIAEKWGNGIEQKLINDYNECNLIDGGSGDTAAYSDFLRERKALKLHIKTLLNETI